MHEAGHTNRCNIIATVCGAAAMKRTPWAKTVTRVLSSPVLADGQDAPHSQTISHFNHSQEQLRVTGLSSPPKADPLTRLTSSPAALQASSSCMMMRSEASSASAAVTHAAVTTILTNLHPYNLLNLLAAVLDRPRANIVVTKHCNLR